MILTSKSPSPILVRKAKLLNSFSYSCLRLLSFSPKQLGRRVDQPPSKTASGDKEQLEIGVVFLPCRKLVSSYTVPLKVFTSQGNIEL